jgi:hypothetical protein
VLDSKPRIFSHLIEYWTAFQRLTTCRPLGPAGAGHIPWTAIERYAEREGWEGAQYEDFVTIIEGLDKVSLAHKPPKASVEDKPKPGK